MPFRERLKTLFGKSISNTAAESSGTLTPTNSGTSTMSRKERRQAEKDKYKNWPEHIYKPHEMPRPKYRQPPTEEHTRKLQAFSWDSITTLRRRSGMSQYSPMGSRMPSISISSKTQSVAGPSRNQSIAQVTEADNEGEGDGQEGEGEQETAANDLSRQTTRRPSAHSSHPHNARRHSLSKMFHLRGGTGISTGTGTGIANDNNNDAAPMPSSMLMQPAIAEQSSKEASQIHTPIKPDTPPPKKSYDDMDWPFPSPARATFAQNQSPSLRSSPRSSPSPTQTQSQDQAQAPAAARSQSQKTTPTRGIAAADFQQQQQTKEMENPFSEAELNRALTQIRIQHPMRCEAAVGA